MATCYFYWFDKDYVERLDTFDLAIASKRQSESTARVPTSRNFFSWALISESEILGTAPSYASKVQSGVAHIMRKIFRNANINHLAFWCWVAYHSCCSAFKSSRYAFRNEERDLQSIWRRLWICKWCREFRINIGLLLTVSMNIRRKTIILSKKVSRTG